MQNVLVKAVGKFKEKFNQTGLLLDAGQGEFWANFPGQLNWKQYKDKRIDVELQQDSKGYWSGTFAGQQAPPQAPQQPTRSPNAPQPTSNNRDLLIVRQVVYKALMEQDFEEKTNIDRGAFVARFKDDVKLIMTGGEQSFQEKYDLGDSQNDF